MHGLLFRNWRFLQHECEPLAGRDFLIVLIEAAVNKGHNTPIGFAMAFPHTDHFSLDPDGVAMKEWLGKAHVVPSQIGYRRP